MYVAVPLIRTYYVVPGTVPGTGKKDRTDNNFFLLVPFHFYVRYEVRSIRIPVREKQGFLTHVLHVLTLYVYCLPPRQQGTSSTEVNLLGIILYSTVQQYTR
jgi:hypothetical protein